jgi:hypothetical protein
MGNLTNSVEKGFSQPWEPLSDALENKRGQRQGFERTNFFFSFFSSQSSQLEGAQKMWFRICKFVFLKRNTKLSQFYIKNECVMLDV